MGNFDKLRVQIFKINCFCSTTKCILQNAIQAIVAMVNKFLSLFDLVGRFIFIYPWEIYNYVILGLAQGVPIYVEYYCKNKINTTVSYWKVSQFMLIIWYGMITVWAIVQ